MCGLWCLKNLHSAVKKKKKEETKKPTPWNVDIFSRHSQGQAVYLTIAEGRNPPQKDPCNQGTI